MLPARSETPRATFAIAIPTYNRRETVRLAALSALRQTRPPAQVIVAATRTSAGIAGLDDLGVVATAKSADFVVLDANPLDDITNTRRISRVYLRGAEVPRAELRAKWQAEMRAAAR